MKFHEKKPEYSKIPVTPKKEYEPTKRSTPRNRKTLVKG